MLRDGVKAAQEGNRTEARKLLLRVTETDENNENAWLWLASISEYPEELLVFLNNVLRINPENERALEWHRATQSLLAKTLVQRGVDAFHDERPDFARQCFEQALEHEAENETAWLWMASVAAADEEKKSCFEKVFSINPENETAREALAAMAARDEELKARENQALFETALAAAFDGHHADAQEKLETVLAFNSELEDAWVLKAHLAHSFEERAECFLKLRALNPENEMANACLASWRMLADQVAALPKPEDAPEMTEAAAAEEEAVVAEPAAEAPEAAFAEAPEAVVEEAPAEEFAPDLSNFPTPTPLLESEFAPATDEAPVEAAAAAAEAVETPLESKYLSEDEMFAEEYPQPDSPTQDLRLAPEFEAAPEPVEELAAAEPAAEFVAEEPAAEFAAEAVEEAPAAEARFEAEPAAEARFEAEEEEEEPLAELSDGNRDLAAEMVAEETEMHWAFAELLEEENRKFAEEAAALEPPPVVEVAEGAFNEEEEHEEWRNTSPSVFINYTPGVPENSLAAPEAAFEEIQPVQAAAEELAAEAPAEEMFVAEMPAAEMPEPAVEMTEPVAEMPAAFAPEETPEPVAEAPVAEFAAPVAEFAAPVEEFVEPAPEFVAPPVEAEIAEPVEQIFEAEIVEAPVEEPAPEVVEAAVQEAAEAPAAAVEEAAPPRVETNLCPFCNADNEKQAFLCVSCRTVLTLSDLEMLLNQQNADQEKLQQAVASLESENESYGLSADQMTSLGIGHINLKNYRQGFFYLQEAVRMNPNNVLLDAQVNALAIRLAEIEDQERAHDAMLKNRKILVVDDSPTVRKLISGKLEKCGHEVICAVDGLDALQKINDLVPDLILLDITMPRMDGYQVCKLIRNNEMTREVPVVMISGKDGFFDKVRGKMAGTTGYITKPFGPETLMKTVETYIN